IVWSRSAPRRDRGGQFLSRAARFAGGRGVVSAALRVLLVGDEELARRVLREYLSRPGNVEVLGACENGVSGAGAVSETKPDLLFLDVQMPKLDGFEVLELLDRDVAVVFVTAFDEHAIRAFEVHAVDYLLKPVAEERLGRALARVRERSVHGRV